jgi:biotin carboxylase
MNSALVQPRLLIIGGANPLSSSIDIVSMALAQAKARGIRTHLIHREELLAQTAQVCKLADEVSAVDPDSAEETARWVAAQMARGERFDMVLGLRDSVQDSTARSAALAGAQGNPPAVVRCVQNKDACRAALAAAGFRQPAVQLCRQPDEALTFLRRTRGPWVIKPRDAGGSLGVRLVTGPDDLPLALAELPDRDLFLVEEFVNGDEFSVEGVFLGGKPKVLAVTAKEILPPPHFVEIGHVIPAELPEVSRADIEQHVTGALTELGLRFGTFHVELWLTADGIVLGEVHPRPGGDWLHRMLTHTIPGLELFGLIYDDVLRRPANHELHPARAAAVHYLAPAPGRVDTVRGWAEALAHPGVLHAELNTGPGAIVPPVRHSGDRAGFVVVGADTAVQARTLARRLAESVEFVTKPVEEAAVID